jgi:LysR family transcriptional regulator, nitrogen assimilation regulatory protein
LRAVETAVADLREQSAELSGPVSFAFPSSVSNVLTVPLSETVRNEFPKIVLRAMEAMSGHVQAWLAEGAIDFGILYDCNCARELDMRPLLVEQLYLAAARDCWKGEIGDNGVALEPVALADCQGFGFILPHRTHGLRDAVERFAQSQNVALDVVVEMDSLCRIKSLVARGSGYSILAHAAVHEELERGELVLVTLREPIPRPAAGGGGGGSGGRVSVPRGGSRSGAPSISPPTRPGQSSAPPARSNASPSTSPANSCARAIGSAN